MLQDNYDRWKIHDDMQEVWLLQRPICDFCGERIQDETYHKVMEKAICDHCMAEMVVYVD